MLIQATSKKLPFRKLGVLILCCIIVLLAYVSCFGQNFADRRKASRAANSTNEKGRNLILSGNINEAIASYATLAQNSTNTTLIAEYSYALALGGIYDAALINLDGIGNYTNEPVVKYFTSQVFALMGYNDLAMELWKPSDNNEIPSWIALNSKVLLEKFKCKLPTNKNTSQEELVKKFKMANELILKHLYLQSIALFHEITDIVPNEFLPYAGYSVPLEKIGAVGKSAKVIEKALTLVSNNPEDIEKKEFLENRLTVIKTKMSTIPNSNFKKNVMDANRPQIMAYGGTMIAPSLTNLNFRVGYFISNKSNGSFNFGFTNTPDGGTTVNSGFSIYNRSKTPNPMADFIYGIGIQMTSGGNQANLSMICTLGISIRSKKQKNASFDIFVDVYRGLSAGSVFSQNFSFGATQYFGKRK